MRVCVDPPSESAVLEIVLVDELVEFMGKDDQQALAVAGLYCS